jgi:hypothetical protein
MSVHAKSAVSAIAFLAAAFSLPVLAPHSAANAATNVADTCLTAPDKQAPQGSRWYYRLERPSMRKCWRLVQKDRKEQRAAQQAAPPQGDDAEGAAAAPADRPAATDPKPTPAPVVRTLVTRPVSNTTEATQPPPDPFAGAAPGAGTATAPAEEASAQQAPAQQLDQPAPQPAMAPNTTVQADDRGTPGWGTLLAAIGLLGLLAGAAYAALWIVRRRTDVLDAVAVRDEPEDAASFDHRPPARSAAPEAPTFAPLPPMTTIAAEDDVDEALRRSARRVRRHAA